MDPTQCYREMLEAMNSADFLIARERAMALRAWLDRGGCPPANATPEELRDHLDRAFRTADDADERALDLFGPVIYAYTRKQALADGVLIDAGELAAEAGFRVPVALTSAAWEQCVRVPNAAAWQDENGRLWDVLQMLRYAIRAAKLSTPELLFSLLVQNDERPPQPMQLKAISSPGDDGEHVLTVMLPEED